MLEELCKRIQHCCAMLRRSRKKRNVRSCWLKSLTGFKLCATTPNKTQQHATGCANGSNIAGLRFGDHGTKEFLGVVGWKVWPVSNFAQQHPTTCNRVCKRTQHVLTFNNVGSCWLTMMRPFARVLKLTWLDISTPLLVFFTLVEMFCTKKRTSQYFKKSINKG